MRGGSRFGGVIFAIFAASLLTSCAGLQQFPDKSDGKDADVLQDLDADYSAAINEIYGKDMPTNGDVPKGGGASDANSATSAAKVKREPPSEDIQKQIRNEFIETRLAVIDVHFQVFVRKLARDNAYADLLVALAEVGVGGAGAVVSGGTSQILSAISGGLAGGKEAFDKAALYDKTLTALITQMVATRQEVAARIFTRWEHNIDKYPLWLARQDIAAYEFSGSLPGAIVATTDDAKVKAQRAEDILKLKLPPLTQEAFTKQAFASRRDLDAKIADLSVPDAKRLVALLEKEFPELQPQLQSGVEFLYPNEERDADTDGSGARNALGFLLNESGTTEVNLLIWSQAIESIQ
jgi:hypothetical protein